MKKLLLSCVAAIALSSPAMAGPFIIDGTDADDHGFANAGGNQDGWLYIQKALTNISTASDLTRLQKNVAILGASSTALTAAQSAINAIGGGWTFTSYVGGAGVNNFFANTSGSSVLYIASDGVSGGTFGDIATALTANATNINNFVGSGGGLFSMGQSYGWLSALIPTLTVSGESLTGINLTAAGSAAFPGLVNQDLSSGPYHYRFNNVGALPILGVGSQTNSAIILGSSGGSITNPTPPGGVPEPSTWAMLILGFGAVGATLRRRQRQTARVSFA